MTIHSHGDVVEHFIEGVIEVGPSHRLTSFGGEGVSVTCLTLS
jgi:hypothetical protein